jgi:hypothetical protein
VPQPAASDHLPIAIDASLSLSLCVCVCPCAPDAQKLSLNSYRMMVDAFV